MKAFSWKRFFMMLTGVVFMGVFMSFLIRVNYGTDTYSYMCLALSNASGLSYGTCCLLVNGTLFIPVLLFQRRLIHIGTIMNMVVVGYVVDLCMLIWQKFIPDWVFTTLPARPIVFAASLAPFLVAAALYMNADLGVSPFDALPAMIARKLRKIPFMAVRICWDMLTIAVGLLLREKLPVGTLIMALTIGPAVSIVGRWVRKIVNE